MPLFDVYPLYDVTPVSGKGIHVYDEKGTEYLDLYGGHAVISIGHAHPNYIQAIKQQVDALGFYSNAIKNPLQKELADKIEALSGCQDYELFLCNSGAEANENALKLASFKTGKKRVIAFKNGFHGRTSAAVAATDNPNVVAPINAQQKVTFLELNDIEGVKVELEKGDVCAVIVEFIQGVGGLDQGSTEFFEAVDKLCKTIPQIKNIKGRGLMLGLEFDFEVGQLRKDLIYNHKMFTGGAANKKLLRILPPLNIEKVHIDQFFEALKKALIVYPEPVTSSH